MAENLPAARSDGEYELLRSSEDDLREVIDALHGISPMDLDRVRIPPGGGTFWEIPGPNGPQSEKSLKGIVLATRDGRLYWRGEFGGGSGQPPDCISDDATVGRGIRWEKDTQGIHSCDECRLSKFGSDGRGQACKQIKLVLMLTPSSMVPMILSLPPTSLQLMRQYALRLIGAKLKLQMVETEWTLRKTKNRDGIEYAQAIPRMSRKLLPKEIEGLTAMVAGMKEIFSRRKMQAEDYRESEDQETTG